MINNIDDSWKLLFFKVIDKDFFREIETLREEDIYPEKENIFRVFEMPLSEIKVVLIGQDPYPKPNQAVGLVFAVPAKTPKPASLKIIEKEIGHSIDRTMIPWKEQGVFLLNTALTVKRGTSGSHIELWHNFTKKVIKFISENNPCIWILLGKYAQDYVEYIDDYVYEYPKLDELGKNIVLVAAHPAAEAYKDNAGFLGSGIFNQANNVLGILEKEKIIW